MYTEYMYINSLAHHGIKGQKWGVRRFQNADGTLTPAGKERYYGKGGNIQKYDSLQDMGYKNVRDCSDSIIKKGSKVYRQTTYPNEIFKDRMYVSGTEDSSDYGDLVYTPGKEQYSVTYSLKKNIKVGGRKIIEDVMSDVFKEKIDFNDRYTPEGNYNSDSISTKYADFMYDKRYEKERKEAIKKFKTLGYNAIMDPVDSAIGLCFDPSAIILFDDCLKLENIKKTR